MTQLAALHKIPEDAKGRNPHCWVFLHLQHLTLLIFHPLHTFMNKQFLVKGWVYREPFRSTNLVKNLHLQSIHWDRKYCLPESHVRGQLFSTEFAFLGIFSPFFPHLHQFQVPLQLSSCVCTTNDTPSVCYPHREKNLLLIIPPHLVLSNLKVTVPC